MAGLRVGSVILDEVDSTNAHAARISRDVDAPVWILAHRQTKGRGRRGRPWQDPVGNFAATFLCFPTEPIEQVALNSFVAALSLYNALNDLAPSDGYELKWPNDVLLNGKKIAGILLETSGNGVQVDWLSIGIGVNLTSAPMAAQTEPRATPPSSILSELGIALRPEDLLTKLARNIQSDRETLQRDGFDSIRQRWLCHAAKLGEQITARTMRDETVGVFEDVDAEGNLILKTQLDRVAITAVDVYF